jgi:hypothetical protein
MARLWGDPADGEICDACAKPITKHDHGRYRLDSQRQEARSVSRQVFPVLGIRRGAHRRRRRHGVGSVLVSPEGSIGSISSAECRAALPGGLANEVPWCRGDPRHRGCTARILRWGFLRALPARRPLVRRPPPTPSRLLHARALKSNGASSRIGTRTPPSASSSCSGCLKIGAAGRFAGSVPVIDLVSVKY